MEGVVEVVVEQELALFEAEPLTIKVPAPTNRDQPNRVLIREANGLTIRSLGSLDVIFKPGSVEGHVMYAL